MPHYADGTVAEVGDRVLVEFEVTAVHAGETACNVSLRAAEDVEGEYVPVLTTNTRYCRPKPAGIVWGDGSDGEERESDESLKDDDLSDEPIEVDR